MIEKSAKKVSLRDRRIATAKTELGTYLFLGEIAAVLGISKKTIKRRLIKTGLLRGGPLYRDENGRPGPIAVLRSDFEAFQKAVSPRKDQLGRTGTK